MSQGHMQMSDGGMAMNMNAQHHMEHFDNVLNLNMNNDFHYGMEYWNGSYKNGSTPMKEMEGEMEFRWQLHAWSVEFNASSRLSTATLTPRTIDLCNLRLRTFVRKTVYFCSQLHYTVLINRRELIGFEAEFNLKSFRDFPTPESYFDAALQFSILLNWFNDFGGVKMPLICCLQGVGIFFGKFIFRFFPISLRDFLAINKIKFFHANKV